MNFDFAITAIIAVASSINAIADSVITRTVVALIEFDLYWDSVIDLIDF